MLVYRFFFSKFGLLQRKLFSYNNRETSFYTSNDLYPFAEKEIKISTNTIIFLIVVKFQFSWFFQLSMTTFKLHPTRKSRS